MELKCSKLKYFPGCSDYFRVNRLGYTIFSFEKFNFKWSKSDVYSQYNIGDFEIGGRNYLIDLILHDAPAMIDNR